jgi:hypothetical protein
LWGPCCSSRYSSVLCYLALFVFVMCLIVYPMLLGSLDCTFLIFPSVFLTFIYLIDHNKGLWSINMYTQISMQTVLSNGHCIHTLFPYIHKYEKILKKIKTNFIYSLIRLINNLLQVKINIVSPNPVDGEMYSIQHYVIKFCQWLVTSRWFLPGTPSNKIDRHDINQILLKVALNTINHKPKIKVATWITI